MSRNMFSKAGILVSGLTAIAFVSSVCPASAQSLPTQDPAAIPKYVDPMIIPPEMPKTGTCRMEDGEKGDYYEIGARQFDQQVLPTGMPKTTVWGYGSIKYPGTFNFPAFTIEAKCNRHVKVKWVNQLVDANGNFVPQKLPLDQTVLWANPPGGAGGKDTRGSDPTAYVGPVPIVTHVHGAHVRQEGDGYPMAWYLPAANDIPAGYATVGSQYDANKNLSPYGAEWTPGSAVFDYANDQRATTIWYHDHTLGMTRLNVYMGLAGFYLIRGGEDDVVMTKSGKRAVLPNPAPVVNTKQTDSIYEIPIVVQDRSFNVDGSLFYPDSRAYFDGFSGPYAPLSDIAPIYNPEFFGNSIVVNGRTWPYLQVEQRRYRFRMLNGCTTRALILQFPVAQNLKFWQIGTDQGFLPAPVSQDHLLMASSTRADVIVDFTNVPVGTDIILQNVGPDEPYNGANLVAADPATTGQVMQFRVIKRKGTDTSTPPDQLILPARTPLGAPDTVRQLSLNELDSAVIPGIGPSQTLLGNVAFPGGVPTGTPMNFTDAITEKPVSGNTETWEIYNFTVDGHPVHVHQVAFEVVNREIFDPLYGTVGTIIPPAADETGTKDTTWSYPGEILRLKAKFDIPGKYVWHCHIVDHEDNEMMRPYDVQPGPQDIPAAPSHLKMGKYATFAVMIWKDNSDNERYFELERSLSETGPFIRIATLNANLFLWIDRGLAKNTNYFYRVRAVNNYGASAYSSITSAW